MAWNSTNNKSDKPPFSFKTIGPGAPVAQNPGFVGKPYRDMWDVERAYREGFQKVTWVTRCIDAIAGNQARLPIILRKDNSRDGEVLMGRRALSNPLIEILNTKRKCQRRLTQGWNYGPLIGRKWSRNFYQPIKMLKS